MQFTRNESLKIHVEAEHEGVKYPCDQCDHQATRKSNLKSHMKIKHKDFKLACDQCDYPATIQGNLTRHIQLKHFKHACNQCDAQLTSKSSLLSHEKSEHPQKENRCNKVNQTSTSHLNFKNNMDLLQNHQLIANEWKHKTDCTVLIFYKDRDGFTIFGPKVHLVRLYCKLR